MLVLITVPTVSEEKHCQHTSTDDTLELIQTRRSRVEEIPNYQQTHPKEESKWKEKITNYSFNELNVAIPIP